jgi:hypothetical protein
MFLRLPGHRGGWCWGRSAMRKVFERLSKYWIAHNTRPASSLASQDDISRFQERYGVRLPADLKEYVLNMNGNHLGETLEMDSTGFSFLPLSAMQPERNWSDNSYQQANMFVIADFLVKCYWYCAELDSDEHDTTRIFFSGGAAPDTTRLIANSLADFLDLYMTDSPLLHPTPSGESGR